MAANLTPTMIEALNTIGRTGEVTMVRIATLNALISRELVWDNEGVWFLTSDAHNLDEVTGQTRQADLDRQEAAMAEGRVYAPDGLGQRDPNEGIDAWFADMAQWGRELLVGAPKPRVNVTTTDVSAAEVVGLVQLGSRLFWGKLINVIRRGTRFSPDFLVTVEVAVVRRLVKADHYLAA